MTRARTALVALLAVLVGAFVLAGPAAAHVTVSAPGATSGGSDQQITFRVPVEEKANTTKITIEIPTNTPIGFLDVVPVPGWTDSQQTTKLKKPIKTDDGSIDTAVSQVTWTATSGGLKPGEIGLFNVVAGQLPDTKQLVFRALQTYANGDVVRWTETAAPGSNAEPEHPAPTLDLTADTAGGTSSSSSSSSNTVPLVLSIVALVLALAALALAVARRRQQPAAARPAPPAPATAASRPRPGGGGA
jgi:uncharacterized protein YcnI